MKKTSSVKRVTITAAFIALCYVLPLAFHAAGVGSAFSPMHIPVLMCGLICGGGYGLFCGIAGPILSSVLSGMPGTTQLIYFVPELMIYGFVSGLTMKRVHTKKRIANIYISLIIAMIAGRVVGCIVKTLFYLGSGQTFAFVTIVVSYFVTSLPGIICHLIVIPLLVTTLTKARLIPNRYPKGA